jgi:multicomponent Na+:H+ antiporter subunit G
MIDVVAAVLLIGGSLMSLTAAIGLVRFPDVLTRMHAATKPQTVGLLLILGGIAVHFHTLPVIAMVSLVAVFQLVTAPVAAHMVARNAYRADMHDSRQLTVDELADG